MPIQIVGTPAVTVTRSDSSSSSSAGGERSGPGMTSDAPAMNAGVRQPPGVRVEHRHDRQDACRTRAAPNTALRQAANECSQVERCE